MTTWITLALALAAPSTSDTVLVVRPGDRMVVEDLDGELTIDAWSRDQVRLEAPLDASRVRIEYGDGVVRIEPRRGGWDHGSRVRVTVPAWMSLDVRGRELEVTVEGVRGGMRIRTRDGDVRVSDAGGSLQLSSVDGQVLVRGASGSVEAESNDDDVRLTGIRGDVLARSVDGDVILRDIEADRVEASTVDGDVEFRGPLRRGGEYRLSTHDGDVVAWLQQGVDADVSVSTFEGDFVSDFPVTLREFRAGEVIRFSLGSGGASVILESFDGSVELRRQGSGR